MDAAYASSQRFLQPLRNLWQGSEGICWLLTAPAAQLESGECYLDRTPQVKHIAGPFFSEGSFTKNTRAEEDGMLPSLSALAGV